MAEIELDLSLDARQTIRAVDNLGKKLNDFGSKAEKNFGGATQSFNVFTGVLTADLAVRGLEAITSAASALFNTFVTQGVQAAQAQEDAINQLNTALRLSGSFSEEASQGIQDFASALQQVTTVGDEVIIQQVALAKNFGLTNEQAKELVAAAVDLSAATGISLDSAVRNLGKTFSGLTGELGESLPQIRGLTKEALQSGEAIRVVAREFGGFASQLARTFSGAVQQASNSFGDLQESTGEIITSNETVIALINTLSKTFSQLEGSIDGNQSALQDLVSNGITVFLESLRITAEATDVVVRSIQAISNAVSVIIQGSLLPAAGAFALFSDQGKIAFQTLKESVEQDAKDIQEALTQTGGASDFAGRIADFQAALNAETEAVKTARANQLVINQEADALEKDREAVNTEEKERKAQEEFTKLEERNELLKAVDEQRFAEEIARNEKRQQALLKQEEQTSNFVLGVKRKQIEKERQLDEQRLQAAQGFFSNLTSVAAFGGKQNFEIAKAAATAEAIVSGALAVQKALASAPPPFNFALAASVGVRTAAQIRTIQAQALQSGIDSVPGVIGQGDNFPAILAPGERVVPTKTNQDLTEFLASSGQTNELLVAIRDRLDNINPTAMVQIGNQDVLTAVNDAIDEGGSLAS